MQEDGQDLIIRETEITRKFEGIRILQLFRIPQLRGEGGTGKKAHLPFCRETDHR
jgi:hypothetical protein